MNGGKNSAYGTSRVPRNDMLYNLHQGERVLTKQDANKLDKGTGNGITIAKLADTIIIREEMDIDVFAKKFAQKLQAAELNYGG